MESFPLFLPLQGKRVAISISESSIPSDLGASTEEVNRLTVRMAELLLSTGACVIFGHNWRSGGVMDAIYSAALRYRVVAPGLEECQKRIINLLPWPEMPGLSSEEQSEASEIIEIRPTGLASDCETFEAEPPFSIEHTWSRARSLTKMRRTMVETADAMVCIGGRTSASQGRYPGVVEEVLLMTDANKPVYLSSLMGGAAQDMIRVIEHADGAAESLRRIQTTGDQIQEAFDKFGSTTDHDPLDYESLEKHFSERLTLKVLEQFNGLEADEHWHLLHATGQQQVLTLVLRGLMNLTTGQRKATPG